MYGFKFGLGYGLIGGNTYNPLINYDWSTTTTSGLRYLKDVGSTPTYNASMYFGRGAYLNGVDQTITVPINTTIQTALKRVNGVITISETSQALTNYVIRGLGVHKDYYLFTRLLTTAEKDSYTNTPEAFYAMAQDDSACVLNMPMCETDGYVRNMKSYSEVQYPITYITSSGWNIDNGVCTIVNGSRWSEAARNYSLTNGEYYGYAEILSVTGKVQFDNTINANFGTTVAGILFGKINVVENKLKFVCSDSVSTTATVKNIKIFTASGIYPITNYTSSVRDNAKNLQYGLQTCKFVRDSLGVIQSASNYLECDGVGYADTGWIPNTASSEEYTVEFITQVDTLGQSAYGFRGIGIHNLWHIKQFNLSNGSLSVGIGTNYFTGTGVLTTLQKQYIQVTVVVQATYFTVFLQGVKLADTNRLNKLPNVNKFYLGVPNIKQGIENMTTPIRLFKVHNKELTQEEITANYNSYVAKGLLT